VEFKVVIKYNFFNMFQKKMLLLILSLVLAKSGAGQVMHPGAERTSEYFSIIKGKHLAVIANQSSLVGSRNLVDTLIRSGMQVVKIFSPEHGFRGNADAGEEVSSGKDITSGIEVVSLYGKKLKPSNKDLRGIDIVIFDIQDVGVRFFTYLGTLQYAMEACAENNKPIIVLDRPNPNGFYVDGPVLDMKYRSFVGMNPVPIVYGMTIGEYAQMINQEGWLKNKKKCALQIINCENYDHNWSDELPVRPSPNLPNLQSILLYPSICLFEGTNISLGRGTDYPFQVFGHPDLKICNFKFTPHSIEGMSKSPLYQGKECCGLDLRNFDKASIYKNKQLVIDWLILAYTNSAQKDSFFNGYFDTLTGNKILKEQVSSGQNPNLIRESWKQEIEKFLIIRKKYLLYKDF
jgi:uncharacterized protein YbbC (DUF1343 family)